MYDFTVIDINDFIIQEYKNRPNFDELRNNYAGKRFFIKISSKKYPEIYFYPVDKTGIVKTFDDANEAMTDALINHDKYIFSVMRSSDMTEGRGPMCLNKIFKSFDDAHEYVMKHPGIMGGEQMLNRVSAYLVYHDHDKLYLCYHYVIYNGYDINVNMLL